MKWEIEKRSINSLKSNRKNPRRLSKNDADQLKKSLEKFGVCEPIVINCDGTIIGGHQRVKTLKSMGYKDVDVYVPIEPLSEEESDELLIRLNRNQGTFNHEELANLFEVSDLIDWGFSIDELGFILDDDDEPDKEKEETENCPICGKKMKKNKN